MLSRGGGGAAMQKIVATVNDLPSPLDANPGERIIVRKTQEVYGLDATTRMWTVIGTLKKVGGKRPEELAAHIDNQGNPHKTTLQDILDVSQSVKVTKEIAFEGKADALLRLMGTRSALRWGQDAGDPSGIIWVNTGPGKPTAVRVVNPDGDDQFVVDADGSVKSKGSASFAGGFSGEAHFDDEITAAEGLYSAEGYDLVLGGDKGVVFRVGGRERAILTDTELATKGRLVVGGDLSLGGAIQSNLTPRGDRTLGTDKARWKSAAIGSLDLAGPLLLRVPANAKKAPLQVSGAVPGDSTILTAGGELGLGTDAPERRLDVRGDGLVVGSKAARISINEKICFNKGADGKAQDPSLSVWALTLGTHRDEFIVARNGSKLLCVGEAGGELSGDLKVGGNLVVTGQLSLGGVSGLSGQSILFAKKRSTYTAQLHSFSGQMFVESEATVPFAVGEALVVDDGNVLGSGTLGTHSNGWAAAYIKETLAVGATMVTDGAISHHGDLTLNAPVVVVGPELRITSKAPKVSVLNELRLEGSGGAAVFSMGGPACGLSLEGKSWALDGVTSLKAGSVQTASAVIDGDGVLADFKDNGHSVASVSKAGLRLTGGLQIGNLAFKTVKEELTLSGQGTRTKLELPAGVRIEAVVVKVLNDVTGARFLQIGDQGDPDRFAGPSTSLKAGSVIRGLNHWGQSRAVQKVKGPIVLSGDAAASGKVLVTVHYVDPAAL